mmetsp:Transcript_25803/g.71915  ORF Transcript_25803/g.71915 Transcript_25803/m.71915 type:complete len:263 (+) Transcript_25803:734-1522(+)
MEIEREYIFLQDSLPSQIVEEWRHPAYRQRGETEAKDTIKRNVLEDIADLLRDHEEVLPSCGQRPHMDVIDALTTAQRPSPKRHLDRVSVWVHEGYGVAVVESVAPLEGARAIFAMVRRDPDVRAAGVENDPNVLQFGDVALGMRLLEECVLVVAGLPEYLRQPASCLFRSKICRATLGRNLSADSDRPHIFGVKVAQAHDRRAVGQSPIVCRLDSIGVRGCVRFFRTATGEAHAKVVQPQSIELDCGQSNEILCRRISPLM